MIYKLLVIAALLPSLILSARAEDKKRDAEASEETDEYPVDAEFNPLADHSVEELIDSIEAALDETLDADSPSDSIQSPSTAVTDLVQAEDEFFSSFSELSEELPEPTSAEFHELVDKLFSLTPPSAGNQWISDELRIVGAVRMLLNHGERQAAKRRAEVSETEWNELVKTGMIQTHLDTEMGKTIGNAKLTFHRLDVPVLDEKGQPVLSKWLKKPVTKRIDVPLWRVFLPEYHLTVLVIRDREIPKDAASVLKHLDRDKVFRGRMVYILELDTKEPEKSILTLQPRYRLVDVPMVDGTRKSLEYLQEWFRMHVRAVVDRPRVHSLQELAHTLYWIGVQLTVWTSFKVTQDLTGNFPRSASDFAERVASVVSTNSELLMYIACYSAAVIMNQSTYSNLQESPSKIGRVWKSILLSSTFSVGYFFFSYLINDNVNNSGVPGSSDSSTFDIWRSSYLVIVNTLVSQFLGDDLLLMWRLKRENHELAGTTVRMFGLVKAKEEDWLKNYIHVWGRMTSRFSILVDQKIYGVPAGEILFWFISTLPRILNPTLLSRYHDRILTDTSIKNEEDRALKLKRIDRVYGVLLKYSDWARAVTTKGAKDKFLAVAKYLVLFPLQIPKSLNQIAKGIAESRAETKAREAKRKTVCSLNFSKYKSEIGRILGTK